MINKDKNGIEFVVIIETSRGWVNISRMEQVIGLMVFNAWVSPNTPKAFVMAIQTRIYPLGVKVKVLGEDEDAT
jgi:hypothetical protein